MLKLFAEEIDHFCKRGGKDRGSPYASNVIREPVQIPVLVRGWCYILNYPRIQSIIFDRVEKNLRIIRGLILPEVLLQARQQVQKAS